jgi:hypothetical protein
MPVLTRHLVIALVSLLISNSLRADETIRVMAANLTSGNLQSYDPGEGNRIFQGLHPDIALIQETNVGVSPNKNTPATYRAWVTANFGSSFSYFVEPSGNIPNGIVSRYPIIAAGEWDDSTMTDRDYVWAKIDIPGDKNLWAISVHISSGGGASQRSVEAAEIKKYISDNIPAADYVVLGGDFNTDTRGEGCINTLDSTKGGVVVVSGPYPVDRNGSGALEGTNASRKKAYDWVMADPDLSALATPLAVGSQTFANGLVFDSRIFSPLSNVSPVISTDSGATGMQHMAVMRAFLIPVNTPPTLAKAADSSSTEQVTDPDSSVYEIVRGKTVGLSVMAADNGGEAALKYTWTLVSGPGNPVSFSANGTNAAKNISATFSSLGNYDFSVTVQDGPGLAVTSSVKVRVVQAASSLILNPPNASLAVGGTQDFSASLLDQFNQPMIGTFTWSASAGGTINSNGLFTATTAGGPFTVTASSSGFSATSSVTVTPADAWAVWKDAHFTASEQSAGLAEDQADPDADGWSNLAEYALGSDPRAFTPPLPYELNESGLAITFTHPADLPGIHYFAESSSDLQVWAPLSLEMLESGPVETWRAFDPTATPPEAAHFLRLRFERE